MRIGILSPISWRVPPRQYGPWEQVVSILADGLSGRGLDVTLFASGDSITKAKLVSVVPKPVNEDSSINKAVAEFLHYTKFFSHANEFDILHNHMNCYPLAFSPFIKTPIVTTLHGSALLEDYTHPMYRRFKFLPYVSISNAEREGLPELNYVATVYNGIDLKQFHFCPQHGKYLLFLGRISPEKGTHLAINVAQRTGLPLKIAAMIPPEEQRYFEEQIESRLKDRVEYIGPVGPKERDEVLGKAFALLHLVTVPEPFGLVMVEAMATGTPVIGIGLGSIPEVVKDGETGFVVENVNDAVEAVQKVRQIDRRKCRKWVEQNFTAEKMVDGYIKVYEKILAKK
jgi:glycosyltransferase involved in cell wall biosynthesis